MHRVENQLAGVYPATPILRSVRPTDTPSQPLSTMKAVIESWAREDGSPVLAKTVYQSASQTPDIQHLVPERTQPPWLPIGRVGDGPGPDAGHVATGLGLREPEGGAQLTGGDAGQVALLLVVVSGDEDRADGKAGQEQHQGGRVGVLGHLLYGDGEAEDARSGATELRGQAEAEQIGSPKGLEDVNRVVTGGVDLPSPGLDLVLGQATHAVLERLEFRRKIKVHGR